MTIYFQENIGISIIGGKLMNKTQELFMCPECKCGLSKSLECNKCGNEFTYKNGVYDIISSKLSNNHEILWKITDEMIEEDVKSLKERENENIEDYNSYKNEETIEAQKLLHNHMEELVENLSGVVCDLATGMGSMLQILLNAKNKDFNIVCTDIDKRILMSTKKIKETDDNRASYIATDGRYLSIKDESFNYITSLAGFGNIPESDKVAKELYRVLKPNGKILIQGAYIEEGSKSFELAKSKGLERGLVERYLIDDLKNAGFGNIKSTIVAEAIWAENPYDLLPVGGDNEHYCIIQAECIK